MNLSTSRIPAPSTRERVIGNLLQSRNLFNTQTVEYELTAVYSLDLDPTRNFLLAGLSNGCVDLQGVQDPSIGTLDQIARIGVSNNNCNRVQWSPGDEQFFSSLDKHALYLVDPVECRVIDEFRFDLATNWSEWNPNDRKLIAVCANDSQVRLVDIRSGSSVQTIILEAKSGLSSHRANRCLWSNHDLSCLIVGDNEGYIHIYDTRHSSKPQLLVGEEIGQISGMSFTNDNNTIITSQGPANSLIEWNFDRCSLTPKPAKFAHRTLVEDEAEQNNNNSQPTSSNHRHPGLNVRASKTWSSKKRESLTSRQRPLPVDAYVRCQFYVSDRHLFCPERKISSNCKKELAIYDLNTGSLIKTLNSDEIMCQGTYAVTGLLPEALVLYVGGRKKLRLWTIDEGYQKKLEEKVKRFHTTTWDSEEDM